MWISFCTDCKCSPSVLRRQWTRVKYGLNVQSVHTEGSMYVWRLKIVNLFGLNLQDVNRQIKQAQKKTWEPDWHVFIWIILAKFPWKTVVVASLPSQMGSPPEGILPLGWALRLRKPGCALWSETVSNTRLLAWPQLPGELPPTIYHSARKQRRTSCQNWDKGTEFFVIQFES